MRRFRSRWAVAALAAVLASITAAGVASQAGAASIDAATPPPAADEIVAGRMAALVGTGSPVIGDPKAGTAIVEFFDYACPYCKAVEPRLEATLRADRGVKLVLKEFPILTPESMVATRVALAAKKQGKYAQVHQTLMNYRGPLKTEIIYDAAKNAGVDMVRLRRDMGSAEVTDEIIANFNLARSLRLFQTPTFIVGNHILTGPSAEIDFAKAVAQARAR